MRRGEAFTVPERLPGLWLQERNSAAQEFALQKYKRLGKRHVFPVFFGRSGKADDAVSQVSGVFLL